MRSSNLQGGDRLCDAALTRSGIAQWGIPHSTEVIGGHWLQFSGNLRGKVRTYFKNYLEAKIFNVGCRDYRIVFGHTHLPGRGKIKINKKKVEVFNTGGWLLNETGQMPGAAYVTIQDYGQVELNYFR